MAGQEELGGLRNRELQVHAPAVAQHHQKEAQAPPGGAHPDAAEFTPVNLGGFTWSEVQLEKRLLVARTDAVHVVFDDGAPALVRIPANVTADSGNVTGIAVNVTEGRYCAF
ncbi:hypothetical protein GALL_401400 [mine drainage metagenome]|uniref:Uncharacterized protein n=1 Tax=mine drainage metagenome TaxID=410659 RepID=A0A1J5Q4E5_9ZZZZ